MGQSQFCVGLHDDGPAGGVTAAKSYRTPACHVCNGMIIPGDRTVICQGGCQHMARLASAGVVHRGSRSGAGCWQILIGGSGFPAYHSARAALKASERLERHGVVYEYTSKVHRSCMSSQRIRVAHLGPGKQTLCKNCVAFHNFNAGRSYASKKVSAYCWERIMLEHERKQLASKAGYARNLTNLTSSSPYSNTHKPGKLESSATVALTTVGETETGMETTITKMMTTTTTATTWENQLAISNKVKIAHIQKQREALYRYRQKLEAARLENMAVLKQACHTALAADARACQGENGSRTHFSLREAKYAYNFVNQCVPDAVEATEALRRHIAGKQYGYYYHPLEKKNDAVAIRNLEKSILQLHALQERYKARTQFFEP